MSSLYEIVTTTTGALSIRNTQVNEIMHNPVGPWVEANSLYIQQSNLKEKLSENTSKEFVVFDVGLGAAANALAALHCAKNSKRPLRIVSFERDLELLRFALANSKSFDHFSGYEKAIETLLETHHWSQGHIHWELRHGDFIDFIEEETHLANLVFYDPYSPSVNQDMWTLDVFKKLRNKCSVEGAVLLTYSKATPIRVALLCAGFFIGAGAGTGEKDETTFASTTFDQLPMPFAERWFQRWKKSHAAYPLQTLESEKVNIEHMVLTHPQFKGFT